MLRNRREMDKGLGLLHYTAKSTPNPTVGFRFLLLVPNKETATGDS